MTILRFVRDQNGIVAPLFAVGIIPLIGLIGAAADYSRAGGAQSAIQSATDATALAMSKDAPRSPTVPKSTI